MAKYCHSVPIDGVFASQAPLLRAERSRLMTCKIDDVLSNCGMNDPRVFGAAKPCGPTRSLACVPGCSSISRYSTCDWETAFEKNYSDAEQERNLAERLRNESWKDIMTSDKKAQDRQCSNTKKLAERVYDIAFWKSTMLREIRMMDTENGNLAETLRVLERILCETNFNRSIVEECLVQREKRLGIDCVHDDVERALCKELEIMRKVQEMLKEYIQRAKCQLKKNRAVQHNCEVDVRDKHHAQGIDDRAHQLRNASCAVNFYPGVENIDDTITTTTTYPRYTNNNVRLLMAERQASEKLRGEIDCFLRGAINEMWHQFNQTNAALNARVQEVTDAKCRLQAQLEKVNNEIRDTDRTIQLLRRSIMLKENYLKVAQTRLTQRTLRRCIELTRDQPMLGLKQEVKELFQQVCNLKDKLHQSETTMCRLLKMRATLEQDIAVKENSIQIDSSFVLGLRRKMAMEPRLGPILVLPHVEC